MAEEKKDPIQLLAEKRGVAREEIVKELRELDLGAVQPDGSRSGGFAELYEKGIFAPATFKGDRVAHEAFGKALGSDQDLFRAFDHYKRINSGGKGVQEILKEAGDSYGAAAGRSINELMPWAGDIEGEFNQFLYGPYNFTPLADGTYAAPWLKEQAQEKAGLGFEESDAEKKEREDKEAIEAMKAEREEQKAQAQAIALDRDPEARMLRMQNAQTQNNPFLFGTEGVSAQTDRFLDVAGREKPFRNYSDARMRAKQDLDMDSRAFVADAARENIRELDRLDRGRRATVDNNFENMMQWTVNNPEHEMAKKGPNNWTDQEKIKFVQALNLGKINLDEPASAAPAAPAAPAPAPAPAPAAVPQAPMAQAPAPQAPAPAPAAPAPAPAAQAPVTIDDPAKADLVDSRYKLPAYSQQVPPAPETKEGFTAGLEIPGHRVFDYDPNTPPHPGGAGRGRSGKKQFNIPALEFLNLDNYTAREVPTETVKKSPMIQPPPGMPVEMTANERFPKQPTLDEPDSALPPQDPFNSKPAYTAENAQQDYNEIKAMRDMEEAKRINQLNSQIQLTNMQKSKAQNIADTKAYHNQTVPTYGKRNDGTYGVMYDPRSPQAMKERSVVMQGINNSKSGDMFQDIMDSRKEEDERKRRQQQFVTASKNSPYYTNYFGS
jgi:hypothetical protein